MFNYNIGVLNIDVIFSASEIQSSHIKGKTVVVIDVLRATSVMVTALQNAASKVVPVLTTEAAFSYRERFGHGAILVGERKSERIEGFDYGNSPLDMVPSNVRGKTVIITTTNGTRAINNSLEAEDIYVAAFLNAGSTARFLKDTEEVVLVCSGSNGGFTMEDTLCAGLMAELLTSVAKDPILSDTALAARKLYGTVSDDIHRLAGEGRHYQLLRNKGFAEDLNYCFMVDQNQIVCRMKGEALHVVDL